MGGVFCESRGHAYKNSDKGVGIGANILTKLGEFKYKYGQVEEVGGRQDIRAGGAERLSLSLTHLQHLVSNL